MIARSTRSRCRQLHAERPAVAGYDDRKTRSKRYHFKPRYRVTHPYSLRRFRIQTIPDFLAFARCPRKPFAVDEKSYLTRHAGARLPRLRS